MAGRPRKKTPTVAEPKMKTVATPKQLAKKATAAPVPSEGETPLPEYVSGADLASLYGISSQTISHLVADGVIKNQRVGQRVRYDLVDCTRKYITYLRDKANGRENARTETELKAQKLKAEIALKESQGELHRLRTSIASGEYISVEEVKSDYSRFIIIFKNFAMSLPSKVSARIAAHVDPGQVREIEEDLQKEVRKTLSSFVSRAIVESKADDDGED